MEQNKIINDYFSKVNETYRDDFIQHIWLQVYESYNKNPDKIEKLLNDKKLGKWIVGMISNQLKSNTSSFAKLYYTKFSEFSDFNKIEEPTTTKDCDKTVKTILIFLQTCHPADAILFKLHFGICPITNNIKEPMSFKEIQKILEIPYQTIQKSCLKTKNLIRKLWN